VCPRRRSTAQAREGAGKLNARRGHGYSGSQVRTLSARRLPSGSRMQRPHHEPPVAGTAKFCPSGVISVTLYCASKATSSSKSSSLDVLMPHCSLRAAACSDTTQVTTQSAWNVPRRTIRFVLAITNEGSRPSHWAHAGFDAEIATSVMVRLSLDSSAWLPST
jgi:hypothetical protein